MTRTVLGKAVNGVLTITTRLRRTFAYEIKPSPDEDREIVIEEPRIVGWNPSPESSGIEETSARFRFKIAVVKGKTTKTTLTIERVHSSATVLTTHGAADILARIRGLQNESAALKDAVAKLGAIVGDINKARAKRTQLNVEREKIAEEQERIRLNIKSVGQGTDLGRQYIDTLRKQEERLEEISRLDQKLEADTAAKRQDAAQVARQLTF